MYLYYETKFADCCMDELLQLAGLLTRTLELNEHDAPVGPEQQPVRPPPVPKDGEL